MREQLRCLSNVKNNGLWKIHLSLEEFRSNRQIEVYINTPDEMYLRGRLYLVQTTLIVDGGK
jgi:hypothetical protein